VLAVLVAGVYLVLQPFLSAIAWARSSVATTWPVFHWMVSRAGRPRIAPRIMTLLILTGRGRAVRDRGSTLARMPIASANSRGA
jgi:hypothetical protein